MLHAANLKNIALAEKGKIIHEYAQALDPRVTKDPVMKDGACAGLVVSWICKGVKHLDDPKYFWNKMEKGLPKRVAKVMEDQANYVFPVQAAAKVLEAKKAYMRMYGGEIINKPEESKELENWLSNAVAYEEAVVLSTSLKKVGGEVLALPGDLQKLAAQLLKPTSATLLQFTGSPGHVLGVLHAPKECRFFDPNFGEATFPSATELNSFLKKLLDYYKKVNSPFSSVVLTQYDAVKK